MDKYRRFEFPNIHDLERRVRRLETIAKDEWDKVFEINQSADIIDLTRIPQKKLAERGHFIVRIVEDK